MSVLLSRILLTIVLFPLAAVFNVVAVIALDEHLNGSVEVAVPALLTVVFMVTYWLLLWRRTVRWTRRRVKLTFLFALLASIVSAAISIGVASLAEYFDEDVALYTGIILAALLWLGSTTLIWRESNTERQQRVSRSGAEAIVCPACTYNLTGLRECRCPECGAQFTLDELYASQPGRAGVEIEAG